ncbi:MAG: acyl-CoA dehydrogenase C-terminal domain-containing protein, partial [Myxococcota bacterium]
SASKKLAAGIGDAAFYEAKIETARFYYARILPRATAHAEAALAGAETVMSIPEEVFGR